MRLILVCIWMVDDVIQLTLINAKIENTYSIDSIEHFEECLSHVIKPLVIAVKRNAFYPAVS